MQTRWLDTDKSADPMMQDVRSRCVAKEFATSARDDLFAATPALETVRWLLSDVASSGHRRAPSRRLMALDVKRAFLHAPMQREVYIELPQEARMPGEGDVVGLLQKAMYGTRDAPLSWQKHLDDHLG